MKVTRSASSVACPVAVPGGQGVRPAGLLRGGRPAGPVLPRHLVGVAERPARRTTRRRPAGRRRPVRRRRWLTPRSVVVTGASRGLGLATAAHLHRAGWTVRRRRAVARRRPRAAAGAHRRRRRRSPPPRRPPRPRRPGLDRGRRPHDPRHGRARPTASCTTPGSPASAASRSSRCRPGSRCSRPTSSARSGSRGRCCRRCGPPAGAASSWCRAWAPSAGMPGIGAYSATKGALERWAESLSFEIAPFGLGVTVLVAGSFKTDILELTQTYADPDGPYAALHHGLETSGPPLPPLRPAARTVRPRGRARARGATPLRPPRRRHSTAASCWSAAASCPPRSSSASPPAPSASPAPAPSAADPSQRATVTQHPEESEAIG